MINPALRPMSTSELLDRVFHLYRNNFSLFAGIAVLAPALALAGQLLAIVVGVPLDYANYSVRRGSFTSRTGLIFIFEAILMFLISLVATQVAYGATVYAVSLVHMGKQTTIRESYSSIRPFWGRLVGVSFLISLRMAGIGIVAVIALFFGYAAFVILPFVIWWGVYVYARCCLAGGACVLEDLRSTASVERSRILSHKGTGRIFLILLLSGVLSAALAYVLRVPAEILQKAHLGLSESMLIIVRQVGQFFAKALAGPIETIALVLVYYDERIRKEAFDLEVMMRALDPAREPSSAAQAS